MKIRVNYDKQTGGYIVHAFLKPTVLYSGGYTQVDAVAHYVATYFK